MENASKALLIAGAILICIVLISVGMLVLNSTTDVTDQVGDITSSQAAQSFNSNFTGYAGKQKGSSVKQLMSAIATSNDTQKNGGQHLIKVKTVNFANSLSSAKDDSSTITAALSEVKNSTSYTVSVTGMANGYVSEITILEIINCISSHL